MALGATAKKPETGFEGSASKPIQPMRRKRGQAAGEARVYGGLRDAIAVIEGAILVPTGADPRTGPAFVPRAALLVDSAAQPQSTRQGRLVPLGVVRCDRIGAEWIAIPVAGAEGLNSPHDPDAARRLARPESMVELVARAFSSDNGGGLVARILNLDFNSEGDVGQLGLLVDARPGSWRLPRGGLIWKRHPC